MLGEVFLVKTKIMVSVFKALIKVVVIFNLVLVPVFKKKNLTGTSGENGINT